MKEIKINFSAGNGDEHKWLVSFYKDGSLVNWEEVLSSEDIKPLISKFFFPGPTTT